MESVLGASPDESYTLNAEFVPLVDEPPVVELIAPNGGETWITGTQELIEWTASDREDSTSLLITLEVSTNNGDSWTPLAQGIQNLGAFTWNVPQTPSNLARVRVTAQDSGGQTASDVSDSPFNLAEPAPEGNATLRAEDRTVLSGEPISLPIHLVHDQPATAISGRVVVNPAMVSGAGLAPHPVFSQFSFATSELSPGVISFSLTGSSMPAGSRQILSLVGTAAADTSGISPVTFSQVQVLDAGSDPMVLTLDAGSLEVAAVLSPELILSIPDTVEAQPSAHFDLPVGFASNVPVHSLSFVLEFDDRQMQPQSVNAGARAGNWDVSGDLGTPGRVTVTLVPTGPDTALSPGTGTLCTIAFQRSSEPTGNPGILFVTASATGDDGPLAVTTENGTITALDVFQFRAQGLGGGVHLEWEAASVHLLSGFRVLRADAGSEAGAVLLELLTPDSRPYTDRSVLSGTRYTYWLDALGRDGTVDRLGPVTLETPPAVRVGLPFPNPFQAQVRLSLPSTVQTTEVVVLDVQGRVVRRLVPSGPEASWDGRTEDGLAAPAGIYFLRVQHDDDVVVRRVVKRAG